MAGQGFVRQGFFADLELFCASLAFRDSGWLTAGSMSMPHKIATLLYCFDADDRPLLMERARDPNLGLWSPPGGKLHTADGESPFACAQREAREELGLEFELGELHLTGLISEHGYAGNAHWLMFLFEVKRRLTATPPPHEEGRFEFIAWNDLPGLRLPRTDREMIWPLFRANRGGFFSAHCHCHSDDRDEWTLEAGREPDPARTT